jgi:hypothetical protein
MNKGDFRRKLVAIVLVVALGDAVRTGSGLPIGLWLLGLAPLVWATRRAVRRDRRAWGWLALADIMALVMIWRPGPIGWCLFWTFAVMTALMPGVARFGHAGHWAVRIVVNLALTLAAPWRDGRRWWRIGQRQGHGGVRGVLVRLALPVTGGAVFIALFGAANPLVEAGLDRVYAALVRLDWAERAPWWAAMALAGYGLLRPRLLRRGPRAVVASVPAALPGVSVASVRNALVVFNALFAMQNAMDLVWLWGLVPLPRGMTLAEYAHRGAYPLVVTALLAGAFVLIALRPGSATAADRPIRVMVVAWTAQNVVLVASAALRTLDYIAAYSLTAWRIAALAWMALVAVGLVLVCWRMVAGKTATWLINANAAAALIVLIACSAVDLDAVAADWNVAHARELGGDGPPLDLCYLEQVGPSALAALAQLETRRAPEPIHLWAHVLRITRRDWAMDNQRTMAWSGLNAWRLGTLPAAMRSDHLAGAVPDCTSRDLAQLRAAAGPLTAPARP